MSMVLSERRGAIACLTLNNPAQYNALGGSLLGDLGGRELGRKLRIERAARRRGELIAIAALEFVVDRDGAMSHQPFP